MGFFLVGRSATELRLVTDTLFDDRQAALDDLARISAAPDFAHRDDEVFVVDLSTAMPILVVAPQAAAPEKVEDDSLPDTEDEDDQEAPEAHFDNEEVEEPIADAVAEQQAAEEIPLADALKRAAGTLESEGISAPESVGSTPSAAWPWEAGETSTEEVPGETDTSPEDKTEQDTEGPDESPAESSDDDDEQAEEYVLSALEEPAIDGDGGMLASPELEDESSVRRPVIMGDYADDEPVPSPPVSDFDDVRPGEVVSEELPTDVPSPPAELAATSDPIELGDIKSDTEIGGILADLETIEDPEAEASLADMLVAPSLAKESAEDEDTADEQDSAEDHDTDDLTCDDCVYVKTCPNKDELAPSACGNFQWKAV